MFLHIKFVESFCHEGMLNFVVCVCVFTMHWNDCVIFNLHVVNVAYHIDLFAYVEPLLYLRDKYPLIVVYDPFNILLNLVC